MPNTVQIDRFAGENQHYVVAKMLHETLQLLDQIGEPLAAIHAQHALDLINQPDLAKA
jgi:hypothetical protein